MRWYTLGFTYDDVVGAWQDWRLAQECVRAFADAPPSLMEEIYEVPGEGNHLVCWYISPSAAEVLDAHQVPWRQFLVGTGEPPAGARHPLKA